MDTDYLMIALHWARERHSIWEKRQAGEPGPWTKDPVLQTRKFTNLFRVLDPGSQYPLERLYTADLPLGEVLGRAWLYRHSNLPSAWPEEVPRLSEPGGTEAIHDHWQEIRARGEKWSSGAYILRPESVGGKHVVGGDKSEFFTRRCREILDGRWGILDTFLETEDPAERHAALTRPEGVGDFMALQILTDIHYTLTEDRESDFVVPGPGSTRGAAWLSPGTPPLDVFRQVRSALLSQPWCPTIGAGHPPSLMDIQNTLCELSKYMKGPVPTDYRPAHPGPQPAPVLPWYYLHS